jgi:hypothetical protein
MGAAVSGHILNSPAIDSINMDKPGAMLWVDNEASLGEILIRNAERAHLGRADSTLETGLIYFSYLQWQYTKERAEKLTAYIRKHLRQAKELEVWNLWIGYEETVPKIRKHSVCVDKLAFWHFENMFYSGQEGGDWQQYDCLSVKRSS